MIKVYLVEFVCKIDLNLEEINIDLLPEMNEEDVQELKETPQYATGKFHVLAIELGEAYLEASEFFQKNKIKEYEITKISEELQINIINYEKDCDCVFCRALTCSPDERLDFKCNLCGENIAVADGWASIECPNENCKNIIMREDIKLGSDGRYFIYVENNKS